MSNYLWLSDSSSWIISMISSYFLSLQTNPSTSETSPDGIEQLGIILKLKKRKFFTTSKYHHRHTMNAGSLEVISHIIGEIYSLQASYYITELRSFLGLSNALRLFVPIFPPIAAFLNRNHGESQPQVYMELSDEDTHALHTLQRKPISETMFVIPRS